MRSTEKTKSRADTVRNRRKREADAIGSLLPDVLEEAIARKSGMRIDLIAAWPELVGRKYASATRPKEIRWPRRASQDDPFKPGTLFVACEGGKALFLQHELPQLIERINRFFGFEAINACKIVQTAIEADIGSKPRQRPLTKDEEKRLADTLDKVDDPELREKLDRLGRGVMGRARSNSIPNGITRKR